MPRRPATYLVKEVFGPTIQGEGAYAGCACVFLRFAACNLACRWCDTDFAPAGARRMTAEEIAAELLRLDAARSRMVVVTGGEPALQWRPPLSDRLRAAGFRVHMETNGTRPLRAPVDWLTVSPKPQFHGPGDQLIAGAELGAAECKVVVDETVAEASLIAYEGIYPLAARFVQPCMDERYPDHLAHALALIRSRPTWRLSLQLHKIVGLP